MIVPSPSVIWPSGSPSEPTGVADARKHVRPVDDAVAERHVALLVLGDAPHPAVDAVARRVCALLVDAVRAVHTPDLVPAHAGDAGVASTDWFVTRVSWSLKFR